MNRELAEIRSTFLGVEDHGIATAMLHVRYEGSSGQGIGGYALDEPRRDADDRFIGRFGTAEGMQFILAVLRAVGVDSWEKLKDQRIYVLMDDRRPIGIQGLGFNGQRDPFIFADAFAKETADVV